MKFIVTGGAGFIGSHLVERLLRKGYRVICIDNLSSGYVLNLPENKNLSLLKVAVQDCKIDELPEIDGIFHLAAQASVPKSIDDFYNSSANNLLSTFKVWDWAYKLKIPIVYASSSAVYGNLPIGDDTIENYDILSPYAQDKLTMENYAFMSYKVFNTSSIGLRFFNVYGPRQDPTNPYSGVISIFIDRLLKNLPVTVNGGYQTRDFVYVDDIIESLYRSMNILFNNGICEILNVGTGRSITIDNLLITLAHLLQVEPKTIRKDLPEGDPKISSGTFGKLEQVLGINNNSFTLFDKGVNETLKYCLINERY